MSSDWWPKVAEASRSVLMLDYDGTLAPFARERMQARTHPGVPDRLLRLALTPSVRLVLVSGRPARELSCLLPLDLRVEIWGSHGRERLLPDGRYHAFPLTPPQNEWLARFEKIFEQHGYSSALEKKVGSLALHTRGLPEAQQEPMVAAAKELFRWTGSSTPADESLEWLPFDGGIEIRGSGCTKATAVSRILAEESDQAPAAYLGDDRTDEDAFQVLTNRGLRVLVRTQSRPSMADLWLRPPHELLAFLDRWLHAAQRAEVS